MLKSVSQGRLAGSGGKESARSELAAARMALSGSATLVRTLWISFLFFGLYLTIAAGSVTHRQLFLETPISLPLVGTDLPLVGFFWVAPFLFVIGHAYMLLHLTLLAERARRYGRLTEDAGLDLEARARSDMQLPSHVFVEYLVVPPDASRRAVGALVRFVAWFTVVLAPVALLLLVQVSFLPYQDTTMTWVHRGLLLADVILLLLFWPDGARTGAALRPPSRMRRPMFLLGSAAALLFSWGIATFPGERHDGNALSRSFEAVVEQVSGRPLFFNEVDVITGRHGGWFTNALVLPDAPLVDVELVEKIAGRDGNTPAAWGQRSLTQPRGRSFVSANFARADLRRADFRGANLESALLTNANLQDASLGWAQLRNANLDDAQLEGASLLFAQLQGASLRRARLRSASLDLAQLQGASLDFAELPGASLFGAQLQAASLFWAKLPGAMLDAAQLRGASLGLAELQGASLESAQLHGALLDGTQLQGASLDFAGLQGASLGGAQFRGASLRRAFVWRASKPVDGAFEHVRADDLDWTHLDPDIYPAGEKELETRPYPALLAESLRGMESEPARVILSERVAVLDPDSPDPEGTTGERFWQKIQQDYDLVGHADFLVELACADENAPYVAEGLLRRPGMIEHMDFQGKGVSLRILNRLDAGDCPGAVGISGEAMRRLQGERRRQLDLAREVSPRG